MFFYKAGIILIILGAVLESLFLGQSRVIWLAPIGLLLYLATGGPGISAWFILVIVCLAAAGSGLSYLARKKIDMHFPHDIACEIASEIVGMAGAFLVYASLFGITLGVGLWTFTISTRTKYTFKIMAHFLMWVFIKKSIQFLTVFSIATLVLGRVLGLR